MLILEIISVILNIAFLYLLIKEKKACWIYGILGSLSGALVVYSQHLYSESILYIFYAITGAYAWVIWNKNEGKAFEIKRISYMFFGVIMIIGIALSFILGYSMTKTQAAKPFLDALSTVFGIIATFLEIYKYYVAWFFWIGINGYSVWLYASSHLYFYAVQMIIYTVMSCFGLISWSKKLNSLGK